MYPTRFGMGGCCASSRTTSVTSLVRSVFLVTLAVTLLLPEPVVASRKLNFDSGTLDDNDLKVLQDTLPYGDKCCTYTPFPDHDPLPRVRSL